MPQSSILAWFFEHLPPTQKVHVHVQFYSDGDGEGPKPSPGLIIGGNILFKDTALFPKAASPSKITNAYATFFIVWIFVIIRIYDFCSDDQGAAFFKNIVGSFSIKNTMSLIDVSTVVSYQSFIIFLIIYRINWAGCFAIHKYIHYKNVDSSFLLFYNFIIIF